MITRDKIRNFSIIAHIDHGKSTLADRFLEITNTVESRDMKEQLLDSMDLERERGITIKLQPVQMEYKGYCLNLIDTPGHIDFNYEVSRSLAACEGAILVVDATQGIQAQTVANLYLALEQDLEIIPVINKIDLPASDVERVSTEIINLLGCKKEDILLASAKVGTGVAEILDEIIKKIPFPSGSSDKDTQALIFDSKFDKYRGIIVYISLKNGKIKKGDIIKLISQKQEAEVLDIGVLSPTMISKKDLEAGQIGYIVTNIKSIASARVGDTITLKNQNPEILIGYKKMKPFVFTGIFCKKNQDYEKLRDAILEISLEDSSISSEPEKSIGLGLGFRCGFLGLLHLEIITERLRREYDLDLVLTVPSVEYRVITKTNEELVIRSAHEFPDPSYISQVLEPFVSCEVLTDKEYVGAIMNLFEDYHGIYKSMEYIEETRLILKYEMPLSQILIDFYDKLKSVSRGYASLNYEYLDYRKVDVVLLEILVAEEKQEALSTLVYREESYREGRRIVSKLKDLLPKQTFVIKIQACIGGKIIAAEKLSALSKDVLAKLYGGDVTRKMKLLKKQKEGKKRMMSQGRVDIDQNTFLKVLKR
ncbi:translation elongation factor 4 [Patescibacteria group bacterium]|nr:translation elongation factor 4 [Patescibacteria group bacterium]